MVDGFRGQTWLRHVAVAVIFGLAVSLLRQVSISNWFILAGLYVSAPLLTSHKYWPALIVGEMGSLAHLSYTCADQLGTTWALCNLFPSLLLVTPIVYMARARWGLFNHARSMNMGALLSCSLLTASVLTLNSLGMVTVSKLPPGYPPIDYTALTARWMLGNYLGILTITPLAIFLYLELAHSNWGEIKRKLAQSRLALEVPCVLLPTLGFMIWVGHAASPGTQTRQITQIAMFLPVVWLALRHGWHGASIGGTAASLAILALMPHQYDNSTIQAEIVVAFVISTMLLMGARIATLDGHAQSERADLQLALSLAQRNAQLGEIQLRMTSQTLEQIGLAVHSIYMMLTNRLRLPQSEADDRSYQNLALQAKDQLFGLADSLYPVAWQEKGLSSALREGQIPRALDRSGIRYWCDLSGPLNRLSSDLQLSTYRLICDAIAEACSRRNITEIGLHLRCGEHYGRRWAVLRLAFKTGQTSLSRVQWAQLLPQVMPAGSGRGFQAIEDRAATFEGKARERALPNGRKISVLLLDPKIRALSARMS
ncbi:MAG: MASE1 domain-containing protein [Xanthomonadaceae bacterium]|nr:MASE1 domain-containing protein [Xanthomonadaceae bacterium]